MLYLLITGFILWFVIRIIVAIFDFRRRSRSFFDQFTNNGRQDTAGERTSGWSRTKKPKRKKIDSNLGEYIEFEEIADTTTAYKAEYQADIDDTGTDDLQQVSDAEWEDIK